MLEFFDYTCWKVHPNCGPMSQNGVVMSQVKLLPLPDGVPEGVPVECNGKRGSLLVRSQRVVYGGEEMTASRFEQMCGKGEAKKWKCSLWYADREGRSEVQMHDWLAIHGLDRRMLANLQARRVSECFTRDCGWRCMLILG